VRAVSRSLHQLLTPRWCLLRPPSPGQHRPLSYIKALPVSPVRMTLRAVASPSWKSPGVRHGAYVRQQVVSFLRLLSVPRGGGYVDTRPGLGDEKRCCPHAVRLRESKNTTETPFAHGSGDRTSCVREFGLDATVGRWRYRRSRPGRGLSGGRASGRRLGGFPIGPWGTCAA
jgi:hypothetical protein